jgi:hypothetical protein
MTLHGIRTSRAALRIAKYMYITLDLYNRHPQCAPYNMKIHNIYPVAPSPNIAHTPTTTYHPISIYSYRESQKS